MFINNDETDRKQKPKIIVICGPTAIGKTSVAIDVAETFNGEVVGGDSLQIYRFMDIGTAKPTPAERARVPHHMIEIADPDEPYDAARFYQEARSRISDILSRGRLPVVAGGTGFYIKALLYGLCDARPDDPDVRQRLLNEAGLMGEKSLHNRLLQCDPEAAETIHPNDTYRLVRALEVYEITGMPMTEYRLRHTFSDAPYDALKIGLAIDRQILYERINQRVDQMIAEGLLPEVETLVARGYTEKLRPMQALGYRHMIDYLHGRQDWETSVRLLKRDTRRYAKRQFTWFNADPDVIWCAPEETARIRQIISRFLSSVRS